MAGTKRRREAFLYTTVFSCRNLHCHDNSISIPGVIFPGRFRNLSILDSCVEWFPDQPGVFLADMEQERTETQEHY